jgi:CubicO group peptidase (beta-lactamase class C family)
MMAECRRRRIAGPAACALVSALALFAACNPKESLTKKRIKSVEHGLMRVAYLKGLQPDKSSLAERMAFLKVPAVSIAVIDRNTLEWARAYGQKDAKTGVPPSPGTVFQGGAFSQMIAAAVVLELVESGIADLDSPLGGVLSDSLPPPTSVMPDPVRALTFRSLLSHSAGFSDQVFAGYAQDEPAPTLDQILRGDKPANSVPPWYPPAKPLAARAQYSESGYIYVEEALTRLTGKTFPDLIDEKVFGPLGLRNSTLNRTVSDEMRTRIASGHLREGQPVMGLWHVYPESAAKGVWTTPSDFALFLCDLLGSATGGSGKLLSPAAARLMLSSQVENYGFGFLAEGSGDDVVFSLRAKTVGYACTMVLYPAKGQGAVIMTNSDNGALVIQEILCALSEAYKWPHFKPEEKTVLRLAPETYAAYEGRYEVNPNYALDVSREDFYLVIRPTGQAATKFYAEGQTLFYSTDPYIRIQFFSDKQGRFDSLVLWQLDFEQQARRVPR